MKEIKIDNNTVIKVEESLYEKVQSEIDQIIVLLSLLDKDILIKIINEDDKIEMRGLHAELKLEKYESAIIMLIFKNSIKINSFPQIETVLGFHNKKHKPVHKITFLQPRGENFSCSIYKSLLPIQMFKEKI